jgi:hypothetical protein
MATSSRGGRGRSVGVATLIAVFAMGAGLGLGVGLAIGDASGADCRALSAAFDDLLAAREEAFAALANAPIVVDPEAQGAEAAVTDRRARTVRLHGATVRLRDFADRHGSCLTASQRQALENLRVAPPAPETEQGG